MEVMNFMNFRYAFPLLALISGMFQVEQTYCLFTNSMSKLATIIGIGIGHGYTAYTTYNNAQAYYLVEYKDMLRYWYPDMPDNTKLFFKNIVETAQLKNKDVISYKISPIAHMPINASGTKVLAVNEVWAREIEPLLSSNSVGIPTESGIQKIQISDQMKESLLNIYRFFGYHETKHLANNDTKRRFIALPICAFISQGTTSLLKYAFQKSLPSKLAPKSHLAYIGIHALMGIGTFINTQIGYCLYDRHLEKQADLTALKYFKNPEDLDHVVRSLKAVRTLTYHEPTYKTINSYDAYLRKSYVQDKSNQPFDQWLEEKHPYYFSIVQAINDPVHPTIKTRIGQIMAYQEKLVKEQKKEPKTN
jgi:hypothetical protein